MTLHWTGDLTGISAAVALGGEEQLALEQLAAFSPVVSDCSARAS